MEASIFSTPQHDEREEGDVWSDLETLKKLYGLLDKTTGTSTESNNEENLDHKSRLYLMKLLDEATQQTIRRQMKMLPQLANTSSIERFSRCNSEHSLNNSLRCSVQRRDSNLLKSQFSIKSRESQAHRAPTQVPPHPYHPMSRYHGRSDIDGSSKHLIGGSPMYQYHKEKSLYCQSENDSRSNAYKTVEMTPKRILVSPRDQTSATPRRVRLDKVSSRLKKDGSSDETTCSSELHRRVPDQRKKMGKFEMRIALAHNNRLSTINRKNYKSGDDLSVGSSSESNSVASSATSRNSSSSSRGSFGTLPTVPFKKPDNLPATTRSKKPLISQHVHNKSPRGSLISTLPIVPFQKPGNFPANSSSKNKSLQRIINTHQSQKFVSSRRNSKKLAKERDTREQKKGRFKRLKDKLAIVFHHRHDHHHYHHNHASGDDKDHHHRSLWKYLKGILHHSRERTTEIVQSQQHHHHRHMRALFRLLFGHLWGNKQKNKTRLGRRVSRVHVKKLRWWHKFRRGGRMKLNNGRKARLRLRHGAGAR